ncbi:MAG: GAF domain-containing protein [Aggregatilineales bacterium]
MQSIIAREQVTSLSSDVIILWCTSVAIFVLADLVVGPLKNGLWAGYLNLSALVVWLILGLLPALCLVFIGTLCALALRYTLRKDKYPISSLTSIVLGRLAITGNSILVAALVFSFFDADIVTIINTTPTVENLFPIGVALVVSFLFTQFIGYFLATGVTLKTLFDMDHFFWDALPFAVTPALVFTYTLAGAPVFVGVMVLVGAQIIRYRQVSLAKNLLLHRVQELSTINRVGASVTTSLVLEDVLAGIYECLSEMIDVSAFYIALYKSDHDVVEFPYVIMGERKFGWESRPLVTKAGEETDVTDYIISTRQTLHIHYDNLATRGFTAPLGNVFGEFFGVPLMTGGKVMGMLGLMKQDAFTQEEIEIVHAVSSQINLGVRNTMLYSRSVELSHNLTAINYALQNVMFNLDEQDALQLACLTALDIARAQKVVVFLQNQERSVPTHVAYSVGLTDAHTAYYTMPDHMPDVASGKQIAVADVNLLVPDDPLRQLALLGEFRGMMQLPLKSNNVSIGLMMIFFDVPYTTDETRIRLLESLSHQLTAALDNSGLLKALEFYASEQAQLVHLSRVLNETLDKDTILYQFSTIMRQMMNVDQVLVGLVDAERELPELILQRDDEPEEIIHVGDVPELRLMVKPQPTISRIFYQSDAEISDELRAIMSAHQFGVIALVPLVMSTGVMGIVVFGHHGMRVFTDGEWRMIDLATNQLATQLNNAQLYEVTQDALERRLGQLSLLDEIARQISSSLDREQMIRNVLNATGVAIRADLTALGLVNSASELHIIGQEYVKGTWEKYDIVRSVDVGVMGRVFRTGEPTIIVENSNDNEYVQIGQQTMHSSLAVPMIMNDNVIGVLNLESRTPGYFTDEHLEFAKSLAGHAVVSIQNAQLLSERQSRIETLISLRDLSLRLVGNTERSSVYRGILRTALDITQGTWAVLYQVYMPSQRVMTLGAMHDAEDILMDHPPELPDGLLQNVVENREIRMIDDIQENAFFEGESPDLLGYQSLICVPIHSNNEAVQVLTILFPRRRRFTNLDYNTVDLVVIQSGSHLENFDLLERVSMESDRMSAILESTRDGILMLNREGKLVVFNTSAERLLGVSFEQFMGQHFAMNLMRVLQTGGISGSNEEALKQMARVLRLEPTGITNRSIEIRDGEKMRYLEEVGSPVYDMHNEIIGRMVTLRDVTEERELEQYRDEITHMVIHDLRRPLGSIITSLDAITIILEDFGEHPSSDVVKQIIGVSMDSANSLLDLVDTLMDIAKMEKPGFMVLNPRITELDEIVDKAVRHLSSFMEDSRIELTVSIPDDLPRVNVDNDLVLRVIRNLLDNAIRYAPTGGKVHISADAFGTDKVVVRVADNGRGIPPAEAENVFLKFRQIKGNVPAHGGKSTGIGLTFCKQAVEAHHGRIWVNNDGPLPGACFYFTLPINADAFTLPPETQPAQLPVPEAE